MNSFTVTPQLPSWCSSKVTVEIGKAKIYPRIIIHLEAFSKKAMQILLGVSPAGVKTSWFFQCWSQPVLGQLCYTIPLYCTSGSKNALAKSILPQWADFCWKNPLFNAQEQHNWETMLHQPVWMALSVMKSHVPATVVRLHHSAHSTAQQKLSDVLWSVLSDHSLGQLVDTSDFPHECGGWGGVATPAPLLLQDSFRTLGKCSDLPLRSWTWWPLWL